MDLNDRLHLINKYHYYFVITTEEGKYIYRDESLAPFGIPGYSSQNKLGAAGLDARLEQIVGHEYKLKAVKSGSFLDVEYLVLHYTIKDIEEVYKQKLSRVECEFEDRNMPNSNSEIKGVSTWVWQFVNTQLHDCVAIKIIEDEKIPNLLATDKEG